MINLQHHSFHHRNRTDTRFQKGDMGVHSLCFPSLCTSKKVASLFYFNCILFISRSPKNLLSGALKNAKSMCQTAVGSGQGTSGVPFLSLDSAISATPSSSIACCLHTVWKELPARGTSSLPFPSHPSAPTLVHGHRQGEPGETRQRREQGEKPQP